MSADEIYEFSQDKEEVLRGEIQAFLDEFESSDRTEEEMNAILTIWENEILTHAQNVGGHIQKAVRSFMNVCDDYAHHRGMLERVKKEAEETRLHLGL